MNIREFDEIQSVDDQEMIIGGGIHPYYEILYILEGEAELEWLGKTYRATAPSLFLLTSNTPHLLTKISPKIDVWFIELDMQTPEQQFPSFTTISFWNEIQTNTKCKDSELEFISDTLLLMTKLIKFSKANNRIELSHTETLLMYDIHKLFFLIETYVGAKNNRAKEQNEELANVDKSSTQQQIHDLIRYLESNYAKDITLNHLAERSFFTPSYIIRLFKEMTGLTPVQYLHELRMNAAISYLKTTNLSIQEIAESTGYPNIHYFSRMFKQRFGLSPTKWRKHLTEIEA